MEKNIKDYLPFYLGCEVMHRNEKGRLEAVSKRMNVWDGFISFGDFGSWYAVNEIKPILRPLSDMTDEEAKACYKINPYSKAEWLIQSVIVKENIKGYQPNIVQINWAGKEGSTGYASGTDYIYFNKLSAEQFSFLLSKHFDLFGLIEAGLAIDTTTLAKKQETVNKK